MQTAEMSRRRVLRHGMYAAAAVALARLPMRAFGASDAEGDVVIPFVEPLAVAPGKAMLHWDELKDWITPSDQLYNVSHYGMAKVEAEGYKLEIGGLVEKPKSLTLDEIKGMPKREGTATLECSGNGADKSVCSG